MMHGLALVRSVAMPGVESIGVVKEMCGSVSVKVTSRSGSDAVALA